MLKTKEEIAEYNRAYHKIHKEEIAAQRRNYNQIHKFEIAERHRNYYQSHEKVICPNCGRYMKKGSTKCLQCRNQNPWNKGKHPIIINKGTVYSPIIGDKRFGYEVGKKGNGYYIWFPCPKCKTPRWVQNTKGVKERFCQSCGQKSRLTRTEELIRKTAEAHKFGKGKGYRIEWDIEDLHHLYSDELLSTKDIARLKGISHQAVCLALKRFNIPRRKRLDFFTLEKPKNKWAKSVRLSLLAKPNKPEHQLNIILDELYPNQWEYVGDGKKIIYGKNPDFWNGDHKLIELFGDYWHTTKARNYEETEEGRISFFKQYGYKCLVIWEHELKQPEQVVHKIIKYVGVS
jgi:hypothetical protein